ncbi:universal stress protein [Streptomyces sp. NPDC020490]|uniref:universal stress protein n=1 Tax=Streptomyces sp. NPDC020490 TaxID=3365078 RepID=UPI0037A309E0
MTLHHVVVGVDGTPAAVRALDLAADDAARRSAELRVVYAVPDRDEAGPILSSAAARIRERHPGLRVVTTAAQGGAVRALAAESEGAALTVVGTRGFGGVTGTLFGSVSLRLAAQVHGPLMIVRGDHVCHGETAGSDAGERLGTGHEVLLGLQDDTDVTAAAFAFEEAERRGVWLRVLHSWDRPHITPEMPSLVPATSPGQRRMAQHDRAEEAVARFSLARLQEQHPTVGVDARTVRSGAAQALLEATREAAVVVIGSHGRAGRLGPHLGTVAHTLLHHAHCPVLLVPSTDR